MDYHSNMSCSTANINEFVVNACYYFNGYGNITHFSMNCTATCGLLKFKVGNDFAVNRWNYSKTDVCEPTGTPLSLVSCSDPGDCTGGITRRVEVDMESQFGTAVHVICKASEPKNGGTNPTSSKLLISAYPTSCPSTPAPTSSYPSPTTVKSSADSTITPQDSSSITTFTDEFKPTMNTPTFTTDLPKGNVHMHAFDTFLLLCVLKSNFFIKQIRWLHHTFLIP